MRSPMAATGGGSRYPQLLLMLVADLGILSGSRCSRVLEAYGTRHQAALNQALGLNFKRWWWDATFLTCSTGPPCRNSSRC